MDEGDFVCQGLIQPQLVSTTHRMITVLLYTLCSFFIIVTNVLLLSGLTRTRQWKTKSNRLFLFLIVSDFIIGVVTIPLLVGATLHPQILNVRGCTYSEAMNICAVFPTIQSAMTVWLVALERYLAILRKRVHNRYVTVRSVSLAVLFTFMFAFLWSSLHCIRLDNYGQGISSIALGTFKAFIFITISSLYYTMFHHVQLTANETRTSFNSMTVQPHYDRTLFRISMLISVSLIICFLPSTIVNYFTAYKKLRKQPESKTLYILETWTLLAMYFNSGINGSLFLYRNRKLRRWFFRLLKSLLCRCEKNPTTTSLERRCAMVDNLSQSMDIQKVIVAFNSDK